MTKEELTMAEQQLTGYYAAMCGSSVTDLAESMGLTAEEWAEIHQHSGIPMRDEDIKELNDHYV